RKTGALSTRCRRACCRRDGSCDLVEDVGDERCAEGALDVRVGGLVEDPGAQRQGGSVRRDQRDPRAGLELGDGEWRASCRIETSYEVGERGEALTCRVRGHELVVDAQGDGATTVADGDRSYVEAIAIYNVV